MKKILDIGCGRGNLCNYLSKKNNLVYGIDISKEDIKKANENKKNENQIFITGNAEKLEFRDNVFDEIYCYEVLEHVEGLNKILEEIKRVLKKDGILKITVPLKESEKILLKYNQEYLKQIGHKRFFSEEGIRNELMEKGFRIKKHTTCNSIEHFYWRHVFKRGGKIINQLGEVDKKAIKIFRVLSLALSRELYYNISQTKSKNYRFVMNFFILLYPIIILLDTLLINKKQRIICKNEK